MRRVGVIGCGVVGNALIEGFRKKFEVVSWDKKTEFNLNFTNKDDKDNRTLAIEDNSPLSTLLHKVDGPIFVCVSTPMQDNGRCDTTQVEYVCQQINVAAQSDNVQFKPVVAVKSTTPPTTVDKLNRLLNNIDICSNPEFLTEYNATEDFKHQKRVLIGGEDFAVRKVEKVYHTVFPGICTMNVSPTTCEMVKYMTNCLLATKVSFANEMYKLCQVLDIDYDQVKNIVAKDERIGPTHLDVPGNDGKFGFGRSCLPKDLNALIYLAEQLETPDEVLKATWKTNLKARPSILKEIQK